MKQVSLIFSILIFSITQAQISNTTFKIIEPLETYSSFYILDEQPEKMRIALEQSSSIKELYYLASQGNNPYVKAIAVEVLLKKDNNRIIDVFKAAVNSKDEVIFSSTCLQYSILLAVFIFQKAVNSPDLSVENKKRLIDELVGIVLKTEPINIKLLNEIKYEIPKNPENYSNLRNWVIEYKSPQLLNALAQYKNPADIELIKSFGVSSFSAIEEFPDDSFLPFLNEHIQYSNSFSFMFALTNFCNEEAKQIVDKVIEFKKRDNKEKEYGNYGISILYQQIDKEKCPLFRESLETLWLSDKIISLEVLENYENTHTKEETLTFLMGGFLTDGIPQILGTNLYNSYSFSTPLLFDELRLVKVLEKIKSLSLSDYNEALRNSLKFIDAHTIEAFIVALDDNSAILQNKDVLIEKLKTNENAYKLLLIMDGIKRLGEEELYKVGTDIIIQRKDEFLKFPIWERSYKEFIEENKIRE